MGLSGGIIRRTARALTKAGNKKMYLVLISLLLPVFFIIASDCLSSGKSLNNTRSAVLKQNASKQQSAESTTPIFQQNQLQEGTAPETNSLGIDSSITSKTTVAIDGESVTTTSANSSPNQSVNKTINTGNGVANISIQNQTSSDSNTQHAHFSQSVHVNSQSFGDTSTSVNVNQSSLGGR